MQEVKNTQRALVRIAYDGSVHKTFRGPQAYARFENEVRVLRYLESRGCEFVPRLLEVDEADLKIVTTNCGSRVDQVNAEKLKALFTELETFGVHGFVVPASSSLCAQFPEMTTSPSSKPGKLRSF